MGISKDPGFNCFLLRCVAENSIGEAESVESHPLEVFCE